jgi:hypothetical protein
MNIFINTKMNIFYILKFIFYINFILMVSAFSIPKSKRGNAFFLLIE